MLVVSLPLFCFVYFVAGQAELLDIWSACSLRTIYYQLFSTCSVQASKIDMDDKNQLRRSHYFWKLATGHVLSRLTSFDEKMKIIDIHTMANLEVLTSHYLCVAKSKKMSFHTFISFYRRYLSKWIEFNGNSNWFAQIKDKTMTERGL